MIDRPPMPGEPGFVPFGERWTSDQRWVATACLWFGCGFFLGSAFAVAVSVSALVVWPLR